MTGPALFDPWRAEYARAVALTDALRAATYAAAAAWTAYLQPPRPEPAPEPCACQRPPCAPYTRPAALHPADPHPADLESTA